MNETRIRVVIVDDHPIVRKGLASFLTSEPDIEVVGSAADGEESLGLVAETLPDIVLMDLSMPGMGGIEATRRIVAAMPHMRVMMLSSFGGHERMVQALKAGAIGYVVKDTAPGELLRAMREAAAMEPARELPDETAGYEVVGK
jgi:DNA-binding NarL/FixJ family response regulator